MANVFIVGASRGIGLELARFHAERGDDVLALVRDPIKASVLNSLAADLDTLSVGTMDAGDLNGAAAAATAAGNTPIDYLYIVAGVVGPQNDELETPVDWGGWDEAFNIMVKGPLAVFKAFLPRMHEGTKVINFSSQLASSIWPMGGMYSYVAAKSALNGVMRAVAKDVKDKGIVVVLLHPGWVKTDMGGPEADISVDESVKGIIALADSLTIAETGEFFKWNGEKHPW